MRGLILLLATLLPLSASADSALPFMKDLAGDTELPRPWGISIDFYTMDQDYDIKDLQFALPGISLGDPSQIEVTNEVMHYDIQADVWLLPFLNVFGLIGKVDSDTLDGTVYGLGFTLVYGTDNWFVSATTTYTETSTSGVLDSSVDSLAIQPRIGLIRDSWRFWAGSMYLDVDEKHSGTFDLPIIGGVPFSVTVPVLVTFSATGQT